MVLASADGPEPGIHHTFDANKTPTRFRREALRRIADCLEQMAQGKPTNPGGRGRVLKADKERAKAHGARWLARADSIRDEAQALSK